MERLEARNNIYSDTCRGLLREYKYRSENPGGIRRKNKQYRGNSDESWAST